MIVTGEASGDGHGAGLARALLARDPALGIYGMGGDRLRDAGTEVIVDAHELAVMGLTEVLGRAGSIYRAFQTLKRSLREDRPQACVLIDFPDFNLRLARHAARFGVPVIYYISPQVWAWRRGRVKQIARRVEKMLVIFPFEADFYRDAGVSVEYVGHPLAGTPRSGAGREVLLARLGLDTARRTVALMPGSRRTEVSMLLPEMVRAAEILRSRHPRLQFVLPLARTLREGDVDPILRESSMPVRLVRADLGTVSEASDVVVVASGTATLEVGLAGTPMVIVYRTNRLTYLVGRALIHVDMIGMVNIIAGEKAAPELIQGEARPEIIAWEALRILDAPGSTVGMTAAFERVRERLGDGGGSERAADAVMDVLRSKP